jgi:hypothetical protein
VINLQGKRALARTHRAVVEPQCRHLRAKRYLARPVNEKA